MITLDVKKLTSCGSDWESNEYTILSRIKDWSSQLHKNKLFPALPDSIQLNMSLEEILRDNIESKIWFDNQIRAKRLNERITVYEKANQIGVQLDRLLEFVEWALKLNHAVLDEGKILKSFVEQNLIVRKLSTNKNYLGKGYFSVPDNKKELMNIFYYEVDWSWFNDEPTSQLQTKLMRSIPFLMMNKNIDELMSDFINYSQQIFEPMAFIFETDLDFPFRETMYPVVEEKLVEFIK
jgi:hypothetical protein